MSLAAVRTGATKCEPAETLLLVVANPMQPTNSATSANFAIRLIRPSFAAIMNGFRLRRAFLQFCGVRLSGQSETRSPVSGAYPRLSRKGCQRIQNVGSGSVSGYATNQAREIESVNACAFAGHCSDLRCVQFRSRKTRSSFPSSPGFPHHHKTRVFLAMRRSRRARSERRWDHCAPGHDSHCEITVSAALISSGGRRYFLRPEPDETAASN